MQQPRPRRASTTKAGRHYLRRTLRWVVSLHGRPQDIAMGFSIGVFVAFSPTIGFQMFLAAFLATLVGASRAASILPVWITNPLTIPAIYGTTYYIGGLFVPGEHDFSVMYDRLKRLARRMEGHGFWEVFDRFQEMARFGYDVMVPMTIGGIIVGLIAAAICYPLVLWSVRWARNVYQRRRLLRAQRRAAGQHSK